MNQKTPKDIVMTQTSTAKIVEAGFLRSFLASLLAATFLKMVKQGAIEIWQDGAFRPIYVRGVATQIDPQNGKMP